MSESRLRHEIQKTVKRSRLFWNLVEKFPDLVFLIEDDKISRSHGGVEIWNRSAENVLEHLFYDDKDPQYSLRSAGTQFIDGVSEIYTKVKCEEPIGGIKEFFQDGSMMLDLGCGGGTAAISFAKANPKVTITAVDKAFGDEIPLRKSRQQNLKFESVDWDDMPYEDDTFDRIISYESIARYGSPASAKEMSRVAKIGCIFRGTKTRGVMGMKGFTDALVEEGWDLYSFRGGRMVGIYRGPEFRKRD